VRLINRGLTPREIAEELTLPPALDRQWAKRGYYGSPSHNVKGVHQRYFGWFDGNPAHLWEHPPVEESRRWVDLLGGIGGTLARADDLVGEGDLRFAATLLNHAVFAEPDHEGARLALTMTRRQLIGVIARRDLRGVGHEGDLGVLRSLFVALEAPDPAFAVVRP
jgi:alkyl sulfatase BDS1-like metallo-beta-lactamase superfamily hydrolase